MLPEGLTNRPVLCVRQRQGFGDFYVRGEADENADAIGLDGDENIYITGSFSGTANFNPDPAGSFTLASASTSDNAPYAFKLTSAGSFVAVARFGASTGFNYGVGIAPGSTTEVTIVGAPDSASRFW